MNSNCTAYPLDRDQILIFSSHSFKNLRAQHGSGAPPPLTTPMYRRTHGSENGEPLLFPNRGRKSSIRIIIVIILVYCPQNMISQTII